MHRCRDDTSATLPAHTCIAHGKISAAVPLNGCHLVRHFQFSSCVPACYVLSEGIHVCLSADILSDIQCVVSGRQVFLLTLP